jgi:hypothetical protein
MSEVVPVANKVKVSVHKNCVTPENVLPQHDDGSQTKCEHLVYLSVPKAGGDGILLGVTESAEAAEQIASALNFVFGLVHTHQ